MRYFLYSLIMLIAVSVQGQTLKDWFGESLVGYWGAQGFANSGGTGNTMYDASGKGNDGTANGDAYFNGDAMVFDGDGDYVGFNEITFEDGEKWTFSFWENQNIGTDTIITLDGGGNSKIVSKSDGGRWKVFFDGGNSTSLYANSGDWRGKWTYHTLFYDGTNVTFYKNGVEQDTGSPSGSSKIRIDKIGVNSIISFNGSIAHAMIFNRTLSAEEVNDLYHGMPQLPTDYRPEGVQP